jgi:hypothetical protein
MSRSNTLETLPHVVNLSFPGLDGDQVIELTGRSDHRFDGFSLQIGLCHV